MSSLFRWQLCRVFVPTSATIFELIKMGLVSLPVGGVVGTQEGWPGGFLQDELMGTALFW